MSGSLDGYEAAIDSAAMTDSNQPGKILVVGADRKKYLHRLLSNDIQSLQAGRGCYAAYLNANGRMISDMQVIDIGEELLLVTPASTTPVVLSRLNQFIFREKVEVRDMTDAWKRIALFGHGAGDLIRRMTTEDLLQDSGSIEYSNLRLEICGSSCLQVVNKMLGVNGFDLYADAVHAHAILRSAADSGAVQLGDDAFAALRIEAGRPLFGPDMDTDTIPLEAGIEERAISQTKGCYPGQEIITRVTQRGGGRLARKLVGLIVSGEVVPCASDKVRRSNEEIGRITSAAWSPSLSSPIALAYVRWDSRESGTQVGIDRAGVELPARVAALPIAKHD